MNQIGLYFVNLIDLFVRIVNSTNYLSWKRLNKAKPRPCVTTGISWQICMSLRSKDTRAELCILHRSDHGCQNQMGVGIFVYLHRCVFLHKLGKTTVQSWSKAQLLSMLLIPMMCREKAWIKFILSYKYKLHLFSNLLW